MPGSSTCTFTEPDDYQASLDRTPFDLVLTTAQGEFNARVTSARLHHLYLLRSEEDFPRIAYISLTPALVFAGFAARWTQPMVWGGLELQRGEIVFHGRAERFHQRTAGPCSWGLIGLTPTQLERYGGAVAGKTISAPAAADLAARCS